MLSLFIIHCLDDRWSLSLMALIGVAKRFDSLLLMVAFDEFA